jgi:thiol-disulfide isomerase/thioredoxin
MPRILPDRKVALRASRGIPGARASAPLVVAALAALAALAACRSRPTPPGGDVVADLPHTQLEGGSYEPTDLHGHAAIVTFWRPGCPHCARQLPEALAAAKKTGATAVAIMVTGRKDDGEAELRKAGWDQVSLAGGLGLVKRWDITGVPWTLIVRPDGTADRLFVGETDGARLAAALDAVR